MTAPRIDYWALFAATPSPARWKEHWPPPRSKPSSANPNLSPEHLADTLLSRLGVSGGGDDDIALIVVRL
ncbi:hypothetical protein [Streptomyces sp. NPDC056291]|uniref:hypothetical protein n=1 Tax=Streptomyces sp. NPDC056291 TaxID=3345772 RepID=UPI0035DE8276